MKKLKQFFNHSYVSGGIYTIAPLIIAGILNKKYEWLTHKEILGYIKTAFTYQINMPTWSLSILAFAIVFLTIKYFQLSTNLAKNPETTTETSKQIKPPVFLEYTEDTFGD